MSNEIHYSKHINDAFRTMVDIATEMHHEFITPEHFLLALSRQDEFREALSLSGGSLKRLESRLLNALDEQERVPAHLEVQPTLSMQMRRVLETAAQVVEWAEADRIEVPHVIKGLCELKDSQAAAIILREVNNNEGSFISDLVMCYGLLNMASPNIHSPEYDDSYAHTKEEGNDGWRSLVVCMNDNLEGRNQLIGRENELDHTIRVLCRKEKNNPLHVGEPGVGKTALVYGLARLINEGCVPERLKHSRIYSLELGSLLAGTQFRGDFEKRIKLIMDGIAKEDGAIVYIDEIHNLVGAGAVGESSMDASNMLKPYLESGKIRFIGSTTYDEYNRYFSKSKGLVRRFQQIDILEPSIEETINIINQLKGNYETFHNVKYDDDAVEFAVRGSARHLTDRFLPDKAIDLIDEAGAYRQIHPVEEGEQVVDRNLIADLLAKICKVESPIMKEDDCDTLETLGPRIASQIFGQDEAVRQVTESIQMARAGLTEEGKPLASLLFVGPTGVGKTEIARVLAKELGIELVRFDMSEYTEKHTVAKLIGSPAGYVGYEDGGLLTDAIRKTPNCVLLLDEIEKAHSDIYNILLQVMDYARLTDNKGRQSDFRNVILIMTSNAGAQYAAQASVGFGNTTTAGEAMMKQVKKTFKPEFINRLTGTVVFNDMSREMASMILDKKLGLLRSQLKEKNVTLSLSDAARNYILNEGFTREYGARELDRVIASRLKPILMRSILFGPLKKGGHAEITLKDGTDLQLLETITQFSGE